MSATPNHSAGGDPVDPGRDHAPRPWNLFTAQQTTTPHAGYGTADPGCARFGCCYFATDAARDQWIAELRTTNPRQSFYRWDLDRSTGRWTARPPAEPDQDGPAMTDVLAALAQRIVDGHPDGTATVGHSTLAVQVSPDPETDPAADNPDAYTYTGEAVAAFRRGDWAFTTITLQIDSCGARVRATQRGVDHGLAAPDDERDQLAGSLLPDLLAEAAGNLRAAADAAATWTGTSPQGPGVQQRSIPATLTDNGYPVLAWIPTFSTDDSAIAVGYRPEPEYEHAPYVVWAVQAPPGEPGQYRIVDGVYDVEDLGEAMLEATARTEQDTDRIGDYDQSDRTPS
ncbi:hypothetical protein DMB66_17655 [Actinoplanes sp. ATCC 53533]|uniref:hypothetical protein n=1 Tax=Actinoplanes sp. ATCC 53533 TaxID=1288362 RepID=UPI000F7A66AB|nr:hypothetical protein [Actinoplanes sp. ATCC 53533]RSM65103.1 hypothetical protein DMB66_17655 [Actinoplanes sp. ATCC 53533]